MAEFAEAGEAGFAAASRAAELAKAAEEGEDAFNTVRDKYKLNPDYVKFDKATGKPVFEFNGKTVNIEEFKDEYYDFKTGDPPNFEEILKKMNFTEDEIKTPEIQKLIDDTKTDFNKKWEDYQDMKLREKAQQGLAESNPPPQSPEEVTRIIKPKAEAEIKKSWNDILKSGAEGAGKVGKWVVETAIKLAPYGIAGVLLYNVVKDHQAACNGCWKIEIANPKNKCKISNLTCSKSARDMTRSDATFCLPCNAIDNITLCKDNFNPCIIDTNNKYYKQCSDADKTDKTKCGTDGYYLGPGINGINCSNLIKTPEDDKTGCPSTEDDATCSTYCNCDKSDNCSDGKYVLQCVNYNFWGALSDLVDVPVEDLGKMLGDTASTILNILKYVAIGIVVLISVLVVFEIIRFFIYGGSHSGNEQHNVNPPPPPPPAYTSTKNTGNPFDEFIKN